MARTAPDRSVVSKVNIYPRPWCSNDQWVYAIGDGLDGSRIADDPLDTRAWMLQEHMLSCRILRFAAHETVWMCQMDTQ
ncbi:hypothetical protein C8A05DRAFT_40113, partial [Staphylotrichum tortipilum]